MIYEDDQKEGRKLYKELVKRFGFNGWNYLSVDQRLAAVSKEVLFRLLGQANSDLTVKIGDIQSFARASSRLA